MTDEINEIEEAMDKSKRLHGLYADRIFVHPTGQHLRISFGEKIDDETTFHTAIVVADNEAVKFATLMLRIATASVKKNTAEDDTIPIIDMSDLGENREA